MGGPHCAGFSPEEAPQEGRPSPDNVHDSLSLSLLSLCALEGTDIQRKGLLLHPLTGKQGRVPSFAFCPEPDRLPEGIGFAFSLCLATKQQILAGLVPALQVTRQAWLRLEGGLPRLMKASGLQIYVCLTWRESTGIL